MMNISQSAWVGDIYYENELEKELMDDIELITEIQEGYYRVQRTEENLVDEYGEYCYMPCQKGKGAVLYYFAAYKFKED